MSQVSGPNGTTNTPTANGTSRVALVTGASSGIGYTTAEQLADDGLTVYAAARRVERMEPLKAKGVRPLHLDVTNEASCRAVVEQIVSETGRIDVLVNNAGFGLHGALEPIPIADAKYQFDVNVFGLMYLTQQVLPIMRQQHSGRIINVASVVGKVSSPMIGWYSATKFALEALSDALRLEVEPFGIDVVVIQPGAIATEFGEVASANVDRTTSESPVYGEMGRTWIAMMDLAYKKVKGPDVIARTISKAVKARRPRIRYSAPFDAKALILARWLLSDRMLDRLTRMSMRFTSKRLSSKP